MSAQKKQPEQRAGNRKTRASASGTLSDRHCEHFRIIAEKAPVLLWTCDRKGTIDFTNDRWNGFVGKAGKLKRNPLWLNAVHFADRETYQAALREAITTHSPMTIEYRVTRHDGELRWLKDSAEPIVDASGGFNGLIGTIEDITESRKHLSALRHSHEEAQAQERENALIEQMNSYLQVCLSMKETYPVVDYYVRRIFLGCSGAIYLFNDNRTVVEPVVAWGPEEKSLARVLEPTDSWALRQGKVHEIVEGGRGMLCEFLESHPVNGYICSPIIAQGDMIGMLHVQYPEVPEDFSIDEVEHHYQARRRLAATTADNLALALVSLKLREALKQQSVKDPLTQLFNRRYMSESLEREFARCRRAKWELSVILIDIDHFKRYNDEYGHDAGDLVIRELSDFIRANLRGEDIACRFGGEEFLLLMPGAKKAEAVRRAEELRTGVKSISVRYQGSRLKNITVSAGVASCPGCGETEQVLFKSVDQALYAAKEGGRDRVCVAESFKTTKKPSAGKLKSVGGKS